MKLEDINLCNIIKSNYIFLIYIIDYFNSLFLYRDYLLKKNIFPSDISKKQIDIVSFVLNEAYNFYIYFFSLNINNDIYSKILDRYTKYQNNNCEIIYFLNDIFYNRIKNLKSKRDISNEYELFKKILLNIFSFNENESKIIKKNENDNDNDIFNNNDGDNVSLIYKNKLYCNPYNSLSYYHNVLIILFQNDLKNLFFDFLKFLIINFSSLYGINDKNESIEIDLYKLFFLIIKKNFENAVNSFNEFLSFIDHVKKYGKSKKAHIIKINILKNIIIQYIFNHSKNDTFYNINFIKDSNIFEDLNSSLNLLSKINNKESSLFILNKIKKKFLYSEKNNHMLFIQFIDIPVINQFVFDNLFDSLNEKNTNEFRNNYKYDIIKALFKYSEVNGYYYIQKLISLINRFISIDEIKNIIYSPLNKEENQLNNYLEDEFLKDKEIKEEYDEKNLFYNDKDKKLLSYCISKRQAKNYETLAILFEYCPMIDMNKDMFPFLLDNLEKMFNLKLLSYMSYFSIQKNKDNIKNMGKNFYNLSLFFESIISQNKFINSLTEIEKNIFYYYIQIIILEITPNKLEYFEYIPNDNLDKTKIKNINFINNYIIKNDVNTDLTLKILCMNQNYL